MKPTKMLSSVEKTIASVLPKYLCDIYAIGDLEAKFQCLTMSQQEENGGDSKQREMLSKALALLKRCLCLQELDEETSSAICKRAYSFFSLYLKKGGNNLFASVISSPQGFTRFLRLVHEKTLDLSGFGSNGTATVTARGPSTKRSSTHHRSRPYEDSPKNLAKESDYNRLLDADKSQSLWPVSESSDVLYQIGDLGSLTEEEKANLRFIFQNPNLFEVENEWPQNEEIDLNIHDFHWSLLNPPSPLDEPVPADNLPGAQLAVSRCAPIATDSFHMASPSNLNYDISLGDVSPCFDAEQASSLESNTPVTALTCEYVTLFSSVSPSPEWSPCTYTTLESCVLSSNPGPLNDPMFDPFQSSPNHVAAVSQASESLSPCHSLRPGSPAFNSARDEMLVRMDPIERETSIRKLAAHKDGVLMQTDEEGDTPLMIACASPNTTLEDLFALTERLVKYPEQFTLRNMQGKSALLFAILEKKALVAGYIAETMASLGILLNQVDFEGNDIFHILGQFGDEYADVLHYLLRSKTTVGKKPYDLNTFNYQGRTALHEAVLSNTVADSSSNKGSYYKTVKLLLTYGADATVQDATSGRTPVHCAIEKRDFPVLELLLVHCPASANALSYNDNTPLHVAGTLLNVTEQLQLSLVKMLLKHGADKTLRNKAKKLPIEVVPRDKTKVKEVLMARPRQNRST